MIEQRWLSERFEEKRPHLRAVAYRMLGSLNEAEDAVQKAWIKLSRYDASAIENLGGWLTTTVARVCLDMLRSRKSRREEILDLYTQKPMANRKATISPETELLLADSVGLALLVVLDRLAPAERLSFVLHDIFDLPFEEIATIVGRSPVAARQLASRARRQVRGTASPPTADLKRQREVVNAFSAASRGGDLNALLAVLDPDVVLRIDQAALPIGAPSEVRGAKAVAESASAGRAQSAQLALVNGAVGIIVAPQGQLRLVLRFTFAQEKIATIDVIAAPETLRSLNLAVL